MLRIEPVGSLSENVPLLVPPPVRFRVPAVTSTVPVLLSATPMAAVPKGATLRTVPALLIAAGRPSGAIWTESGRASTPLTRLFQAAPLAMVNVPPTGSDAVPALFSVRPSSRAPDELTVVVPFRFVTPEPDIVPPQVSGPVTVTV